MVELDPTVPATPAATASGESASVGGRIGRFTVTGVLGQGGMGVVYEAKDPDLDRPVAIKLIRDRDLQQSLRLLREAQALAMLQHPNVVAVHEVGWHGEDVFVAMEKVDGVSLDRLSPRPGSWREVLALFVQAGRGLVAAHDKGLIHRDVKPQNLLVGRDGRVRVGDFGLVRLARELADVTDVSGMSGPPSSDGRPTADASTAASTAETVDETAAGETTDEPDADEAPVTPPGPTPSPRAGAFDAELTRAAAYLGTPRYMAPEQHARRPATTRSDQFGFCVAMWETLFGEHPFEFEGDDLAEAVTAGRRRPVPRGKAPRWLVAALDRGLAVEPSRRHPTMAALVDLLEQTPARRRRFALIAIAAAVAIAAGGFATQRIVAARHQAEHERRVALDNQAQAEELMEFMLFDLTERLGPIGKLDLLGPVADKARSYYQRRPPTGTDDDLYRRTAALSNVGDVLLSRGDSAGAMASYRQALAIRERMAARRPDDPRWSHDLAASYHDLGVALETAGDDPAAFAAHRRSLELVAAQAARYPDNAGVQSDLATSHEKIGDMYLGQGDAAAAMVSYRTSLALREALVADHPDHPDHTRFRRNVSVGHDKLGETLLAQGDSAGALDHFRRALAVVEALVAQAPDEGRWQLNLAISHAKVGNTLHVRGDAAGALASFDASRALFEKLAAADPADQGRQRYLGAILSWIGDLHFQEGRLDDAQAAFAAHHAIAARLVALDPGNARWQTDLAAAEEKLGDVHLARGRAPDARAAFERSLAIHERLGGAAPDEGTPRALAMLLASVTDALRAQGDDAGALVRYREALALSAALAAAEPDNVEWQADLAVSRKKLGDLLLAARDRPGALVEYRAALDITERLVAIDPDNAGWAEQVTTLRDRVASCCR